MAATHKTLNSTSKSVKFLCSYGGKILPRPSDGRLRYVGGHTRVVSVHRSDSFSDLMMKLRDLCGHAVNLRCQLPSEDLDVLISIKSDDDLVNVIEEYDKASSISGKELKIRAILSPPKTSSSPSSSSSSSEKPPLPSTAVIRRSPPLRRGQYGVVRDCVYYNPCHLQANFPPSYFPKHSKHWH